MKVAVTGAAGFFGWHLRCALRARGGYEVATIDRGEWADPVRLAAAVAGTDVVFHLAGANRADASELRVGNRELARSLTAALDRVDARPRVIYANSIQAGNGTAFGDGKQAAGEHLRDWVAAAGAALLDVRVPNLFGEYGRPYYNSVVATFCHELATGATPRIHDDRDLALLHAQDAADRFLDLAAGTSAGTGPAGTRAGTSAGSVTLAGRPTSVSAVLTLVRGFRDCSAAGELPDLADPLHLALFNTYRAYAFPAPVAIRAPVHADERGQLVECVRAHGGPTQVFCSTSHPGRTRGQHFHRRKVERFHVVRGTAEIALRRLFHDEIIRIEVSGDEPVIVDMPTLWAHAITNTGPAELITLFWAGDVLDPAHPDTYPEPVGAGPAGAST